MSRRISRREALARGAAMLAAAGFASSGFVPSGFVPSGFVPRGFASRGSGRSSSGPYGRRPRDPIHRRIPGTDEEIPVVGLGTWQTFDVGRTERERAPLRAVLRAFVEAGGRIVDSSPMYGNSEVVLGDLAAETGLAERLWYSTKVWTRGAADGRTQMRQSMAELRLPVVDLLHVHNLVDVATHLDTLAEWKAEGRIRYIGISHYRADAYPEVERWLGDERVDFLQINYNLGEREAEERVLPMARERGIAVMVNRPFVGGRLFRRVRGRELPEWAAEFDCTAWSQFFLKFIISHPAVTCVIPATSDVGHLRENMGAGVGRLPGPALRRRMADAIGA